MALGEFQLIDRFFSTLGTARDDVVLGVGDDCAVLEIPAGRQLAVTLDTLVEGVHFVRGADPEALGHKALAVNLSDLAAMGADPAWITLALTLPSVDEYWLAAFARGFGELARRYGVALVGGDTTRGPLSISIEAHGFVSADRVIRRSGACPGDLVYVTGTLGDAALGLLVQQGLYTAPEHLGFLRSRLDRPTPRIDAGLALRGLATSAIDISDGLAADLGHVLEASGCGATLYLDRLPLSSGVREYVEESGDWAPILSGGDDYELCCTVPEKRQGEVERLAGKLDCGLNWIGIIDRHPGLRVMGPEGELVHAAGGFDHFASGD